MNVTCLIITYVGFILFLFMSVLVLEIQLRRGVGITLTSFKNPFFRLSQRSGAQWISNAIWETKKTNYKFILYIQYISFSLNSNLSSYNLFLHSSRRIWRDQRVIRIRKSKKNRQHNGQKKKYKRTNNDLQNIHMKLKFE